MDLKETLRSFFKEMVLPELNQLKSGQERLNERLNGVENRLSDINAHLVDQSRRIDAIREELNGCIDALRDELNGRIDETNRRIDETNKRLDRLYEVIVRREEHTQLRTKVTELERG